MIWNNRWKHVSNWTNRILPRFLFPLATALHALRIARNLEIHKKFPWALSSSHFWHEPAAVNKTSFNRFSHEPRQFVCSLFTSTCHNYERIRCTIFAQRINKGLMKCIQLRELGRSKFEKYLWTAWRTVSRLSSSEAKLKAKLLSAQ